LAAQLRAGDGSAVLAAWRSLAADGWQHALVQWQDGAGVRRGTVRDVDADGALVVECDGRRERVIAGDVVWERHR
jgi:biotin-(acetyl-CoA carboxylase) ligase